MIIFNGEGYVFGQGYFGDKDALIESDKDKYLVLIDQTANEHKYIIPVQITEHKKCVKFIRLQLNLDGQKIPNGEYLGVLCVLNDNIDTPESLFFDKEFNYIVSNYSPNTYGDDYMASIMSNNNVISIDTVLFDVKKAVRLDNGVIVVDDEV